MITNILYYDVVLPGFAKVLNPFLLLKFEVIANLFTNFVYTV